MTTPQPGPEAEQAWRKACVHLAEARAMDLSRTPGAAVHSAYYAMHHVARAVLLRQDGERAATRHGSVIGRFGQVAKDHPSESAALVTLGRSFHLVHQERNRADYDVEGAASKDIAEECLRQAEAFMSGCGRVFGFRTA